MDDRTIQGRIPLRSTVQMFNATRADDMIGIKAQTIGDDTAGPLGEVVADPEANMVVSEEDTNPVTLIPPKLSDPSTPWIQRTYTQLGTQNVQVIGENLVIDQAGVELAGAGSSVTVEPYRKADASLVWVIVATYGTVNLIP